MESIRKRAERAFARAQALGLSGRDGKPLVIDQMLELVAAEEGFRNWHAFAASQRKRPGATKQTRTRPGFLQQIDRSRERIASWPQWMQDAVQVASATFPASPGANTRWVIYAESENDPQYESAGFWNNDDGWGARQSATVFTSAERDRFDLPLSAGDDARWLAIDASVPPRTRGYSARAERLECVRCGLPTNVDADGLCGRCFAQGEEGNERTRALANAAYESYDFGFNVEVVAAGGWMNDGRVFERPVFVRFENAPRDVDTAVVDFRVVVDDGQVQDVRAIVRDTGEALPDSGAH